MRRKSAVALKYERGEPAPSLVASGKGALAERMLEIALENGITVVSDPFLADILSDEQVGSFVPVETWEAVAAIFAFLERGRVEKWF